MDIRRSGGSILEMLTNLDADRAPQPAALQRAVRHRTPLQRCGRVVIAGSGTISLDELQESVKGMAMTLDADQVAKIFQVAMRRQQRNAPQLGANVSAPPCNRHRVATGLR